MDWWKRHSINVWIFYRNKNEIGVDTSKFAKKVDLVSLRSNVDELDIDKLKNASIS